MLAVIWFEPKKPASFPPPFGTGLAARALDTPKAAVEANAKVAAAADFAKRRLLRMWFESVIATIF
jgi:hypothetical protein